MTSAIERRPGQTLWVQVAGALRDEIAAGSLSEGTQLPPEPELMRRFGVSRFTVRQAMSHLQSEGLVRVEHGKGSFVARPPVLYDISRRTRYSQNLRHQGLEPGRTRLIHEVTEAEPTVAEALGLAAGAPVIRVRTINSADGAPVNISETFLDAERFGSAEPFASDAPTSDILRECGVPDFLRAWTTISARLASADEAALLGMAAGAPVLVNTKLDVDTDHRPLMYAVTVWPAELVTFRYEEPLDQEFK